MSKLTREDIAALMHEALRILNGAHKLAAALTAAQSRIAELEAQAKADAEDMKKRKDAAYLERNQCVSALSKVFPAGTKRTAIEGWSEDWHGCVFIDLPTGQASWHYHDSQAYLFAHLSEYAGQWDGHTTEEKYQRLAAINATRERGNG